MAGERLKNALKKYRVRYQKAARNERTQLANMRYRYSTKKMSP